MTTEPRRALAALAFVPVAAGAFAGSVVWAVDHSPVSEPSDPPAGAPVVNAAGATGGQAVDAGSPAPGVDPEAVAIAEQLETLRVRLAAVQAELDARAAQGAARASAPAAGPAPRAANPAPRPQAAAVAPPVDTTTRASG